MIRVILLKFICIPSGACERKLVEANEGLTKLEALHCKVRSISGKDALKLFRKDILKGKVEASPSSSKENSQVRFVVLVYNMQFVIFDIGLDMKLLFIVWDLHIHLFISA